MRLFKWGLRNLIFERSWYNEHSKEMLKGTLSSIL